MLLFARLSCEASADTLLNRVNREALLLLISCIIMLISPAYCARVVEVLVWVASTLAIVVSATLSNSLRDDRLAVRVLIDALFISMECIRRFNSLVCCAMVF